MAGKLPAKSNPFKAAVVAALASFTIGAETSNAITVSVQLKDSRNRAVAQRCAVHAYLSDDANGDSIVATAMTSALAAGTNGVVESRTTGKSAFCVTESNGTLDIVCTYTTGAKTCYLVLVMPDGSLVVSSAITFA